MDIDKQTDKLTLGSFVTCCNPVIETLIQLNCLNSKMSKRSRRSVPGTYKNRRAFRPRLRKTWVFLKKTRLFGFEVTVTGHLLFQPSFGDTFPENGRCLGLLHKLRGFAPLLPATSTSHSSGSSSNWQMPSRPMTSQGRANWSIPCRRRRHNLRRSKSLQEIPRSMGNKGLLTGDKGHHGETGVDGLGRFLPSACYQGRAGRP